MHNSLVFRRTTTSSVILWKALGAIIKTLLIVLIFIPATSHAEALHKKVISAELLGRSGLYSLAFDHLFTDNLAVGVGLLAG